MRNISPYPRDEDSSWLQSRKNEAECQLTTVARVQCSKVPSWNYERQDDEEHNSGPDERIIVKGASINTRSFIPGGEGAFEKLQNWPGTM